MAVTNDSSEATAVEEAYQVHVQNLFKVLVTNLIDARVSHQTEQQCADRSNRACPLETNRLELRENSLQSGRRKVEEGADLDRQKPVGRVYEINRQRFRLKLIEQGREGSAH